MRSSDHFIPSKPRIKHEKTKQGKMYLGFLSLPPHTHKDLIPSPALNITYHLFTACPFLSQARSTRRASKPPPLLSSPSLPSPPPSPLLSYSCHSSKTTMPNTYPNPSSCLEHDKSKAKQSGIRNTNHSFA